MSFTILHDDGDLSGHINQEYLDQFRHSHVL